MTLHTAHLTPPQQAYLARNPTYSAQLTALSALAREVSLLKLSLQSHELGKLSAPSSPPPLRQGTDFDVFDDAKRACRELERRLRGWDDEVAGLAEALLGRPRFGVGEEVVRGGDGGWWWRVPEG